MISVKRQTSRTTRWLENFANNISIFYVKGKRSFQFAITTTKDWGDFSEKDIEDPSIDITIGGNNYQMPLSKLETILKGEQK